jgi:hypothetical protein
MAPGVAQQIISAIKLMQGEDGTDRGARKIRQLKDNSNYFRCAPASSSALYIVKCLAVLC